MDTILLKRPVVMDQTVISDLDIQALVDNQLSWEEEKRVRAHIAQDTRAKARFEMLKHQKVLLNEWWSAKHKH